MSMNNSECTGELWIWKAAQAGFITASSPNKALLVSRMILPKNLSAEWNQSEKNMGSSHGQVCDPPVTQTLPDHQ